MQSNDIEDHVSEIGSDIEPLEPFSCWQVCTLFALMLVCLTVIILLAGNLLA